MNVAIIASGGNGTRINLNSHQNISKQFICLNGIPVLVRTLSVFSESCDIDLIVVVTRRCDIERVRSLADEFSIKKVAAVIEGGASRQESVYRGISAAFELAEGRGTAIANILIHDGARPFVTKDCIHSVTEALRLNKAAAAGVAVIDTIKKVSADGVIQATVDRDSLVSIQTPQGFDAGLICSVHKKAVEYGITATDDCALVEVLTDEKIKVTPGDYNNIKITTPEDILRGESILAQRQENKTF